MERSECEAYHLINTHGLDVCVVAHRDMHELLRGKG